VNGLDHGFQVRRHNAHYEGIHDEREMRWRRICAVEKAANLRRMLGRHSQAVRTVLEVGCGTGAVLHEVRKAGVGQVHSGLDVADPGIHADPDVLACGIALSRYDGVRLPLSDDSVDLVYASHVLEHVPDERSFLSELRRVARQFVYVEVPCELHVRATVRRMQPSLDIGHINAYTPEAFALTLVTSGLTVLDLQVFDHHDQVHRFGRTWLQARTRMVLRRALLAANPVVATRIFTYHCGALCSAQAPSS
jgi:SAM-dependent methyltransferase